MSRLLKFIVIGLVLVAILFIAIAPTVDLPAGTTSSDALMLLFLVICGALLARSALSGGGDHALSSKPAWMAERTPRILVPIFTPTRC